MTVENPQEVCFYLDLVKSLVKWKLDEFLWIFFPYELDLLYELTYHIHFIIGSNTYADHCLILQFNHVWRQLAHALNSHSLTSCSILEFRVKETGDLNVHYFSYNAESQQFNHQLPLLLVVGLVINTISKLCILKCISS